MFIRQKENNKQEMSSYGHYSSGCLGQEAAKGPFGHRVKLPSVHVSTTYGGGFTQSLLMLNVKKGSCELLWS